MHLLSASVVAKGPAGFEDPASAFSRFNPWRNTGQLRSLDLLNFLNLSVDPSTASMSSLGDSITNNYNNSADRQPARVARHKNYFYQQVSVHISRHNDRTSCDVQALSILRPNETGTFGLPPSSGLAAVRIVREI